jgi:hypothetical protein
VRPQTNGLPFEYFRWEMAGDFGWTLEYVDSLSMADMQEWLAVRDGKMNAGTSLFNRKPKR